MYLLITESIRRKAQIWLIWELKMLNMRVSEFTTTQITRWGVKNLTAYNNLNRHIDWLTKIIRGQITYFKI